MSADASFGLTRSQPEPAADALDRDVLARLRKGLLQLGHGFGIDDFPLTQSRKKRMATCTSSSGRESTSD